MDQLMYKALCDHSRVYEFPSHGVEVFNFLLL